MGLSTAVGGVTGVASQIVSKFQNYITTLGTLKICIHFSCQAIDRSDIISSDIVNHCTHLALETYAWSE